MRKRWWLAGLVGGLCAAGPAWGQAMTWGGAVPSALQFNVVNTDLSKVPISTPMSRSSGFKLANLFSSGGHVSNKPIQGSSSFPTYGQLPGKDYLAPFRILRPKPLQ
jgi:hypothetical protein